MTQRGGRQFITSTLWVPPRRKSLLSSDKSEAAKAIRSQIDLFVTRPKKGAATRFSAKLHW